MSMIAPDPDWLRIQASDQEEDAWQELQDRLDRDAEHAPATPLPLPATPAARFLGGTSGRQRGPITTDAPAGQGQGATPTEATP